MKAIKDHIFAINLTFQELGKGNFWLYLIPTVVIAFFLWIVGEFFSNIFGFFNAASKVPLIGSYLDSGVAVTKGFFAYIGEFFYQFVILTLLSPIYCLLSENVDNKITGAKFNGGFIRILTDFARMLIIVFFSILLYLTFLTGWWFISWIFGLQFLDGIFNLILGSFFIGFSFYDYSLERYNIGTFKSWGFSFSSFSYMLSTGLIFTLIFQIPIIGVIISPFLATIISTIVFLKMHDKINLTPTKEIKINE